MADTSSSSSVPGSKSPSIPTFESVLRQRVGEIKKAIQDGYTRLDKQNITTSLERNPLFVEKMQSIEALAITYEVNGLVQYSPSFWLSLGSCLELTEHEVSHAVEGAIFRSSSKDLRK